MSPVFDTTTERDLAIASAVGAVRRGALVVLPTDTVYGVGADAFDAQAVAALLESKGRGRDVPPPVLVPDTRTVDGVASNVPAYVRDLIDTYWPGPLTIVLQAQPSLNWDLGETNGTVAVRMPDHDVALAVLAETGPLAVTSANRHGNPAATTIMDAATQLGAAVEVYLDAGVSPGGQASTIVDCTRAEPVVLRHGPITSTEIDEVYRRSQAPRVESEAAETEVIEPEATEPEAAEAKEIEREATEPEATGA